MNRANFHIHSVFSYDGFNSFSALYRQARRLELDAIALTDHDTIEGVAAFQQWLRSGGKTDLVVIPAEEVTCADGTHIIGLFTKSHIASDQPSKVCEAIREQGGFVFFPHPARHDGILCSSDCDAALAMGDFYELFNAKIDNSLNEEGFKKLHATPLAPLAGSDAHYNIDVLKCYCELSVEGSWKEALVRYKENRKIRIFGKRKFGSQMYLPVYYKYKKWLPIPQVIRNLAKRIYPRWINWRDRQKSVTLEEIYANP